MNPGSSSFFITRPIEFFSFGGPAITAKDGVAAGFTSTPLPVPVKREYTKERPVDTRLDPDTCRSCMPCQEFMADKLEGLVATAVDDKLLIEKSIRVRSSDGSKAVAKAVGYTCAKDSCGMLFPLRVSKQQYDRHLREALEKLADVHGHYLLCVFGKARSSVNRSAWSLPVIRHVVGNLLEGSWNELCMNKLAAIIRDVQPPLVNLLTSPSAARWRRPMMTTTVRLQPRQAPRHGGRSGAASGGSNPFRRFPNSQHSPRAPCLHPTRS